MEENEENEKTIINIDISQIAEYFARIVGYNKTILEVQAQILSKLDGKDFKKSKEEINEILKKNLTQELENLNKPSSESSKNQ